MFIPDNGTMFYVQIKSFEIDVESLSGIISKRKIVDNSYSDQIFECIARDDHVIVGEPRFNAYSNKNHIFIIDRHTFIPVGPEVVRALGLDSSQF